MLTPCFASKIELIGFVGACVVVAAGEDHGISLGRLVDARELYRSEAFEQLAAEDRRLVVAIANRVQP
jgi:hypothetical protein